MRVFALSAVLCLSALTAKADDAADQLFDAMGLPALIAAFAEDGMQSVDDIDSGFLGGLGGDVLADTAARLYDPARLEAELRDGFRIQVDPADAAQALIFFDSPQGQRIVDLEVEARQAMIDDTIEEAVIQRGTPASDDVLRLLSARDLVDANAEVAMEARTAFFAGIASSAPGIDTPDIEAQRDSVTEETRAWISGFYALVASATDPNDMDVYIAFWETDVGQAVDDAVTTAFEDSYATLSFGMGQIVGRLLPQNDL